MLEITILLLGYSKKSSDGSYQANASVTLVLDRDADFALLVDTGSPRDKVHLENAFRRVGVAIDDIDCVVATHGHIDHVGNLNLFQGKTSFILGLDKLVSEDVYESLEFTERTLSLHRSRDGEVLLVSTPGHTEFDLSVFVSEADVRCLDCRAGQKNPDCVVCGRVAGRFGRVAIAGDVFEDENDAESVAWKDSSWDIEKQTTSREFLLNLADVIVPGHGRPFPSRGNVRTEVDGMIE